MLYQILLQQLRKSKNLWFCEIQYKRTEQSFKINSVNAEWFIQFMSIIESIIDNRLPTLKQRHPFVLNIRNLFWFKASAVGETKVVSFVSNAEQVFDIWNKMIIIQYQQGYNTDLLIVHSWPIEVLAPHR
ncbi:hypothetical protein BpHYR1_007277 [Brachionus plicatilis]|uniref:Uncharacterized protein n=1 Tax=Brachionus plicatilis TaxID=10195 RepID=A0A3M7Q2P7_BRAPC|nr:hypothetical protein BpHYR1_007277 [Brachionus plicatilis]